MIKLLKTLDDYDNKVKRVYLYADTKSEVTDSITGADVVGMDDSYEIGTASIVRTASFLVGTLNSSHEWKWKE